MDARDSTLRRRGRRGGKGLFRGQSSRAHEKQILQQGSILQVLYLLRRQQGEPEGYHDAAGYQR